MTKIDWHIHLDTDRVPDLMTAADVVQLVIVVLALLFFLLAFVLLLLRLHLVSVRALRPWTLMFMIFGSVVHIVAEYISNAHMHGVGPADHLRNFHCTLWDFWMKYALGLNPWIAAPIVRLFAWWLCLRYQVTHGDRRVGENTFMSGSDPYEQRHAKTRYERLCEWLRENRYKIFRTLFCVALLLPAVLLCIVVEATHGSRYSATYDWCLTRPVFVILVVLWLVFCEITLWLFLWLMKPYSALRCAAYRATRNSAIMGLACLVLLVLLNRLEVSVFWWGRVLTTSTVVFMHVATYLFVTWEMFYDAAKYGIRKDNPLVLDVHYDSMSRVINGTEDQYTLDELMRMQSSRSTFLTMVMASHELWLAPPSFSEQTPCDALTRQLASQFKKTSLDELHPKTSNYYHIEDKDDSEDDALGMQSTSISNDDAGDSVRLLPVGAKIKPPAKYVVNAKLLVEWIFKADNIKQLLQVNQFAHANTELRELLKKCAPLQKESDLYNKLRDDVNDVASEWMRESFSSGRSTEDPPMEMMREGDTGPTLLMPTTSSGSRKSAHKSISLNLKPRDKSGTETDACFARFFDSNCVTYEEAEEYVEKLRYKNSPEKYAMPISNAGLGKLYKIAACYEDLNEVFLMFDYEIKFLLEYLYMERFFADENNKAAYNIEWRQSGIEVFNSEVMMPSALESGIAGAGSGDLTLFNTLQPSGIGSL